MKAAHVRYEYKPFYGSSHWWALRQCTNLPASTRVLDIGSGSGAIGQVLKEQGVAELYAVEIDAEAREHVKNIYKKIAGDIGEFSGQKFDLILLLDVLEHMTDPFAYFGKMVSMLSPGGKILLSLPNVAHWSVRFLLLFGIFDYHDRGIMDRTHYQFFTRKRVRQMLRGLSAYSTQAGEPQLKRCVFDSSIEPVEFLLPEAMWNNLFWRAISKVRLAIARILPGFFAFQHLVLAEKERT
ncbi:MAG: class I SAM-dependent methyltransferase [Patescibacteria group bacterium]